MLTLNFGDGKIGVSNITFEEDDSKPIGVVFEQYDFPHPIGANIDQSKEFRPLETADRAVAALMFSNSASVGVVIDALLCVKDYLEFLEGEPQCPKP